MAQKSAPKPRAAPKQSPHEGVLKALRKMSAKDVMKVAASAGIYTPRGNLTKRYRPASEK